ncbi:hypothetical protein E4414_06050 [Leptospira interrogans]|nr:hypothetical protein E4414_06050 [Leptospira interrogans]
METQHNAFLKLSVSLPMGRSTGRVGNSAQRFPMGRVVGIGTTGNSSIEKRCMSLAIFKLSSLSVFFKD